MASTLHIVDPGFFQPHGHHRSVGALLARTARHQGYAVRLLVPAACPAVEIPEATLVRAF